MNKKASISREKEQGVLQKWGRLILACISIVCFFVTYQMFDGSVSSELLIVMIAISGVLVTGYVFVRRNYLQKSLSPKEFVVIALWLLLILALWVWMEMMSDSFYSDTEYYTGVGVLLIAVVTYSLSFALLWGGGGVRPHTKSVSWQESLIDKPYYRPGLAAVLTVFSFWILFNQPGVPTDISAKNYQQIAQIVGSINLVLATIAVILSIVSVFKVRLWFKIIFIISALIGLWVVAFQILGIALSGGIY